jgi:hypothetical protein
VTPAFFRRAALVVAIALLAVIVGMNLSSLGAILARVEPHRTLRLAVAASSLSLGAVFAGLLIRDFRGRSLPLSISLKPAWLVFGFHLVDFYYFTMKTLFLVTGLLAGAMGVAGVVLLAFALRRRAAA